MKRIIRGVVISLLLVVLFTPAAALGDRRAHHAAIKVCKQRYKNAVRGAKYLRKHQRRERIEQARREREECERLAPR